MLLIYNLPGLLIGLAGLFVGLIAAVAAGSFGVGIIVASIIWCALGFWWRRKPTADGTPRPYPSIFFIPLPFLALFTLLVGLGIAPLEFMAGRKRVQDPRTAMLETAERSVQTSSVSGDTELATLIRDAVTKGNFSGMMADSTNVHVATDDTRVLVIVKVSNLKKFPEPARVQVLDAVAETVKAHAPSQDKAQFIGIKGPLMFGASRTPTGTLTRTTTGDELHDYFGPAPKP